MPKASLSLAKKSDSQGECRILVRLDITRTNRPQFKSSVSVSPTHFVDGSIKIPSRGRLNTALRESLLRKKKEIEAFVASISAIAMALPEEAQTRKDILEVYETVKTVNPSEISRTTIIAKKKEQAEINAELVRELQEAHRPDVLEYIRKRIRGMENGDIKRKGNNYKKGTLHAYKVSQTVLEAFAKAHPFNWEDIDEQLIDKYVQYQEELGYMKKSVNKHLASLSAMLNAAFKDGYRFKTSVLSHFPKLNVTRDDKVEEIYLTEAELQALYELPLEDKGEDIARDIFLVGCYTSQRYSDYSRIRKSNVSFHDGIGIVTLTQQKTDTEVSIPILNDNLISIFEKYGYDLPVINNSTLNRKIKDVIRRLSENVPSLREEIPTRLRLDQIKMEGEGRVSFKRNSRGEVLIPKYDLVTSHTARRTGITLMYLSRILDTHEMMSISGHKTESVFHDYIKLSGIELATGIAKKVAKAKSEAEVKSMLLKQFESMSSEQLARLLELANRQSPHL